MYVDALFRIAVQRRSQVYALSDQLVQQFDVNPSMEAAWILKLGLRPSLMRAVPAVLADYRWKRPTNSAVELSQ
jgi:hypothetical protein